MTVMLKKIIKTFLVLIVTYNSAQANLSEVVTGADSQTSEQAPFEKNNDMRYSENDIKKAKARINKLEKEIANMPPTSSLAQIEKKIRASGASLEDAKKVYSSLSVQQKKEIDKQILSLRNKKIENLAQIKASMTTQVADRTAKTYAIISASLAVFIILSTQYIDYSKDSFRNVPTIEYRHFDYMNDDDKND